MTDSEKLDLVLAKVTEMESKVTEIESKVTEIESKVTKIESKVTEIESKVTEIELTIDNEIRVNIQRVAEGHLDLSRNLHEAMKPSKEMEMLSIKVRKLESGMRDLKPGFA